MYAILRTLSMILFCILISWKTITISAQNFDSVLCIQKKLPVRNMCPPKLRRYDVTNFGHESFFHGWVDVQGQGASNDFCRIVGNPPNYWLSCALAGTHGESDTNYNSSVVDFDVGLRDTWYMKDEDNDGRDDYCRCYGNDQSGYKVKCTKAGIRGFYGSTTERGKTLTFAIKDSSNCKDKVIRQDFGEEHRIPIYPHLNG